MDVAKVSLLKGKLEEVKARLNRIQGQRREFQELEWYVAKRRSELEKEHFIETERVKELQRQLSSEDHDTTLKLEHETEGLGLPRMTTEGHGEDR